MLMLQMPLRSTLLAHGKQELCGESVNENRKYERATGNIWKRRNPLLLAISTGAGNNARIGKQLWDCAIRALEGTQAHDRLFVLIYSIDPEDDPWEESSWIKRTPRS